MTPIPMVTKDNVTIPPGTCCVHVADVISNIGPQKNPIPLKENKTIKSLLIGAKSLPGHISPYISRSFHLVCPFGNGNNYMRNDCIRTKPILQNREIEARDSTIW